ERQTDTDVSERMEAIRRIEETDEEEQKTIDVDEDDAVPRLLLRAIHPLPKPRRKRQQQQPQEQRQKELIERPDPDQECSELLLEARAAEAAPAFPARTPMSVLASAIPPAPAPASAPAPGLSSSSGLFMEKELVPASNALMGHETVTTTTTRGHQPFIRHHHHHPGILVLHSSSQSTDEADESG
ncbi:hypothetical protein FRC17_007987, partial [Serendipita sp. 399]